MNKLKNKDGSAILWTILFTNILVILIGSLLTISMGYHKATIQTVKKQQAYFTARSATDAILSEIAINGSSSNLMPIREGTSLSLKNIEFDEAANMGTASATIDKVTKNKVEVTVNSKYADSNYKMTAKIKGQPIEFGGVAVKNLIIPKGESFNLSENTDLYIDSDKPFKGRINIGGNLIAKGDIHLEPGSSVHDIDFNSKTILDDKNSTNYPRKLIWSADQYVISNQTLKANYPEFVQTKEMLIKSLLKGDYNRVVCNNVYGHDFDFNDNFVDNFAVNDFNLNNNVRYIKVTNRVKGYDEERENQKPENKRYEYISDVAVSFIDEDNKLFGFMKKFGFFNPKTIKQSDGSYYTNENNKFAHFELPNDAVAANVAYTLGWKNYVAADKGNYNHDYPQGFKNWAAPFGDGKASNRYWRKDTFDARQIKYTRHGDDTINDKVSSIAYVMVDKDCNLRVMYGLDKESGSIIGNLADDFYKLITNEKLTYLIVYLGDNSILELGKGASTRQSDLYRLNFYMTVYGSTGSKVILHDNVKLHGAIIVDDLEIQGGDSTSVDYMTSNGGHVNKQQVDELWTISNYSD